VVVCWRPSVDIVIVAKVNEVDFFLKDLFAKKVCTACSKTNNNIVPLTNLNKYLYNGKSEIKVNINNSSEKV
jgi:hypothetical protein